MTVNVNARLSVNHYICRPDISFPAFAEAAAEAGLGAVGVTRAALAEMGAAGVKNCLDGAGLRVSSLNSAGFFTDPDMRRIERENAELIDAAAALEADALCVICGGLNGLSVAEGRARVREGFPALAERAGQAGVTLGVEPIHPADIETKGCINSVAQALDLIDGHQTARLILDFYHSWWDAAANDLLAGAPDRVAVVQLCAVRMANGALVGRDLPGAEAPDIAAWLKAAAGYDGPLELEIFERDLLDRDPLEIVTAWPSAFAALAPS